MTRAAMLAALLLGCIATPALAQDHSGHAMPGVQPAPQQTECEKEAERHRAMGHAFPKNFCTPDRPAGEEQEPVDHSATDHGQDHGSTGHSTMDHSVPENGVLLRPPPPAAGSGPARAADAIWGAAVMRESREALARENGGMATVGLVIDRLEYRARRGYDGFQWDGKAWYGGDLHRAWLESEGEAAIGEGLEDADISLLYGRAISPWFDLQAGVRQDLAGPRRTYLDLGIQGLAPYLFEVEADVYLSSKGDLTATAEIELDQRITQRLIVQPRAEIALSAQEVPELRIGAGIEKIEAGVRLRYEINREFAPYVGIEQEWKIGGSADYARSEGEDTSSTSYVMGIRAWF